MSPSEVLRQPLVLKSETVPNRLAKAAMTEGLADPQGRPTPALVKLYETWARGGAGLLISGNVIVDRNHLERPGNVILEGAPDAPMREALQSWTRAARAHGASFWMQISHAGRQTQAVVNPAPKSASDVALAMPGKQFAKPQPLTEPEILDLIERFAVAARTAQETGFTGAQIHAAHGYLLSQFLSPLANRRIDQWGGPLANRARFLLEIVKRARTLTGPGFTIAVKLNSADFQRGGFEGSESLAVAGMLAEAGVDLLEISGGSYEQPRMMGQDGMAKPDFTGYAPSTAAREAYFLDFAVQMRAKVAMPLMVTGGFRTAAAMAKAVTDDGVALIGLGRPLCVDPAAPAKLLAGAAELDRWEDRLRIGPGLLGPASPIAMVKALNGFGAIYWYYQQFRLIGEGKPVDTKLGILKALGQEQGAQAAWLKARGSR